ncbi:hypothetical protein A1O3_05227 [Capronia epimyces CBS 606.96]|uniref:Polyketide synthase-like phosphopantetheine-binding domain-containing protein n=1 Tax=Capronia epimyces CBS 606.96 TaxID=1182542 RepID=W9XWF4_9EURO|nr:uncharacterized protein A1O3_05227 [Capronia epimyces CBS 606.96]EXJ84558.1 hypothetical protein A1O3_05227 [Capronia epimyces CBS 606.96]
MANHILPLPSETTGPKLDIPIPILHDLITSSVRQHGDKVAIVCKHQPADLLPAVHDFRLSSQSQQAQAQAQVRPPYLQWTHAQLQHGADLVARGLLGEGLLPGSPIAVLLSGRAEFHLVLRAAVKLKCPFTPISPRSAQNAKEIRHMLTLSGAKAVIVEDASIAAHLERNIPDLMRHMQVKLMAGEKSGGISTSPVETASPSLYLSLQEMVATAAGDDDETMLYAEGGTERTDRLLLPRHADDVVFIWFTSGTTSLPKAAPHTNRSLTCNIRSWQEVFELDDRRAWLQILPMNSIVGSSWTLAYLIPGGSVTHVHYNFDVQSVAEAIHAGECTDVLAVPSMIDLLAFAPVLSQPSNRGVDHVIVGGSKILRSHVEKAFKLFQCKRLSPFFGMTEGTSVCTETLYEVPPSLQDPIYAGYVNPGSKIRICAPDRTEPLPRGIPGEIVQGGLQKIERYLGDQGKDNFFTADGKTWYRCGDQAVMRDDGRIAIVGRYKDMIIRGGMNIASAAVEAVISEGTGIEAQIIGIPDPVAGEVPVAILKHSPDDKEAPTKVRQCVLDRMGPAYALERVLNLGELGLSLHGHGHGLDDWPKTTSGKVLKRDLQELVQNLLQSESQPQTKASSDRQDSDTRRPESYTPNNLACNETQLQQYLLERVREQGILVSSIDADFHLAGMDSLMALRLQNAVTKDAERGNEADIYSFPPSAIFECGNIRRLAAYLLEVNRGGLGRDPTAPVTETRQRQQQVDDALVDEMATMVDEYSQFQVQSRRHTGRPQVCQDPDKHTVLLTGATGSLGAHILAVLVERPDVELVYCPVRGPEPGRRLKDSFDKRMLGSLQHKYYEEKVRVISMNIDTSTNIGTNVSTSSEVGKPEETEPEPEPQFGLSLDPNTREGLLDKLTLIIHAAWPVNFQLGLASFKPHLRHLQSLIQLSLDVRSPRPARIYFCSSMGVALTTRGQKSIPEQPIMDFRQGLGNGYTQSKLVAEYVMQNAAEHFGAWACNLRIGQVVGDTKLGLWNENEAPPLMIRSALSLGCLPSLRMPFLLPLKAIHEF